jgi:DNA-binding transcriptional ArsR family regulator
LFNRTVENSRTVHREEDVMAADELSRVFAALADPTRRDLVARLAAGDATVNELAAPYDVTVQAVSKHLKVLEDAGLVSRSRDAQRRPCHLEPEVLDLMTRWIERYRREAEERYQRLDAVLARMEDTSGEVARHPGPSGPRGRTGEAS